MKKNQAIKAIKPTSFTQPWTNHSGLPLVFIKEVLTFSPKNGQRPSSNLVILLLFSMKKHVQLNKHREDSIRNTMLSWKAAIRISKQFQSPRREEKTL